MTGQATFNSTVYFANNALFDGTVNFRHATNPSFVFMPTECNMQETILLINPNQYILIRVGDNKNVSNTYCELRIYPSSKYSSVSRALYLYDNIEDKGTIYRVYHEGNLFYRESLPSTGTEGQICFVHEGT